MKPMPNKRKASCLKVATILFFAIPLTFLGVIMTWTYITPRYLEKRMQLHFLAQGSQDLEVVGYKISVDIGGLVMLWPYGMDVYAEVRNNGVKAMEVTEIISRVTDIDGEKAIRTDTNIREDTQSRLKSFLHYGQVDEVGTLILPGQTRPFTIWKGFLASEENFLLGYSPRYFWGIYGLPALKWRNIETTFVVREAKREIMDWYQYWDNIPIKEVAAEDSGATCKNDIVGQVDLPAIFDDLEQYETKFGIHPRLRWLVTWYDKDGNFSEYDYSREFEKKDIVPMGDGYYLVASGASCKDKRQYKVYLELVP